MATFPKKSTNGLPRLTANSIMYIGDYLLSRNTRLSADYRGWNLDRIVGKFLTGLLMINLGEKRSVRLVRVAEAEEVYPDFKGDIIQCLTDYMQRGTTPLEEEIRGKFAESKDFIFDVIDSALELCLVSESPIPFDGKVIIEPDEPVNFDQFYEKLVDEIPYEFSEKAADELHINHPHMVGSFVRAILFNARHKGDNSISWNVPVDYYDLLVKIIYYDQESMFVNSPNWDDGGEENLTNEVKNMFTIQKHFDELVMRFLEGQLEIEGVRRKLNMKYFTQE